MARSLIILMLTTTQLLAGSGVSLCLCIANDGSYCCVDTGPASCSCCDHQETSVGACCSDPACEAEVDATPCGDHDAPASQPRPPKLLTGDPCGCTHIPVMVSSDEPTTNSLSSNSTIAERLSLQLAVLLAPFSGIESLAPSPHLRWNDKAAIPDFALTVISTVVIRC